MHDIRIVIIISLLAATVSQSSAAESANKVQFATRAQYRACLDSEDTLSTRRKIIEDKLAENNATMLLIQKQAAALVEEQKLLDATRETDVNAFNKRLEEHNKYVNSANERAAKMHAEQEEIRTAIIDHNERCTTLLVKTADREAVLKERKTAGKPAGKQQ